MKKERDDFLKRMGQSEEERITTIKKQLIERTIKLKSEIKGIKSISSSKKEKMTIEMAQEIIQLCESKYGEEFEKLYSVDNITIEHFHRLVTKCMYEIEDLKESSKESLDKVVE